MEAWVGAQWHRWVTRAADRSHPEAAATLAEMRPLLGPLFRAAGGPAATRVAPAAASAAGGPRRWLQRVAGSGERVERALLDDQCLALPATLACHAEPALNRDLYLWLAALAGAWPEAAAGGAMEAAALGSGWLGTNLRATALVLQRLPGLVPRHAALCAAELALRPAPAQLKTAAARRAEACVCQALRGDPFDDPALAATLRPGDVAPVLLWVDGQALSSELQLTPDRDAASPEAGEPPRAAAATDRTRRRAERVDDSQRRPGLVMFFRAESLLSWGEHVRVDRADHDTPDEDAAKVADDLDRLAVADGGQRLAARVRFDLDLPSAAADDRPLAGGAGVETLPEWDARRQCLLPDHCRVQRLQAESPARFVPPPALRGTARRVRRRLETLRPAPGWQRGLEAGDELDLDAWVRLQADAGRLPARRESPPVFARRVRGERSLATLLLADLSLSTDAYTTPDARVIDVIRDALFVFGEALSATGDPFEMLGFSSVRRTLRVHELKAFGETWNVPVRDRIGAIKPGFYTRLGAALRHGTRRLQARPERQRLLLLLSDGKPNDLDHYEGRHGLEDTRHAVAAARAAGLTPFCVTIDEQAHDYLPHLFGSQGWALVHRPAELPQQLARAYASLAR
ncbi:MAG: VWA domain-containing protein [Burkholderiaceae bacterium]